MATIEGRVMSRCERCKKNLLLNPDNNLCINCENESLREELTNVNLSLAQCRREKKELYDSLIKARMKAGE